MSLFLAVSLPTVTGGCLLAAAGAGAGGGVYLTSRGVESVVEASLVQATEATERAFSDLGITRTGLDVDDANRRTTIRGEPEAGEPDVTVTIESKASGPLRIGVTARTSVVTWDKEYARQVLEKILQTLS